MNFTPPLTKVDRNKEKKKAYANVAQYMTSVNDLITFTPETDIDDAINTILEKRISGAPVLNEKQELVGMLSERDCIKLLVDDAYNNIVHSGQVKNYMSTDVKTVSIDMDVVDLANLFLTTTFKRFPVVENGYLRGQISRSDILRAAKEITLTNW